MFRRFAYILVLALTCFGCSDAPTKTALLLTTGEGLSDRTYSNIGAALRGAGYRIEAADIPCHGQGAGELFCWRSMYEEGKSFDEFVASMKRRIEDSDIDVVVGISRAGYLALLIAADTSADVRYVLLAPVVDLFDLAEFSGANPRLPHDTRSLPLNGKRIFIAIGKSDTRVNTRSSVDLATRFPNEVHLVLTDTQGHTQPRVESKVVQWLH